MSNLDVKRCGVGFDLVSGPGESPAKAPARNSTCGAFLVMLELFWWGRLEWSPCQKRQFGADFTSLLLSKVAEIFMRQSWQPDSSFPVGLCPESSGAVC